MTSSKGASTLARFSARNWADSSVYIRISPRPRSLAESKEVLRVMQGFGEVVMFRHLKYEAPNPTLNAALAIFRSESEAMRAVDASPVRFRCRREIGGWPGIISEGTILGKSGRNVMTVEEKLEEREHEGELFTPATASYQPAHEKTGNLSAKESAQRLIQTLVRESRERPPSGTSRKPQEPLPPPEREFELTVQKSIFNHQAYIERQAYYAGFNPDMRTIMAEDLKGRAPSEGYLDCSLNKPDVPLRIRLRRKEMPKQKVDLMEMWEKGRRERGEV
ncbi:MAG: hypothetical protein LQ346_004168 [Caloplaca aetnensis]|nr:MAG: hypothetical protein LQ346_004168 [Caloplaca aetnensis]